MNNIESNILLVIHNNSFTSQRDISAQTGFSLGLVNKTILTLQSEGLLNENLVVSEKGKALIKENSPKNAIILAAGVGLRMVPINTIQPKGLISVKGERIIERLITQLHKKNITDITIVVGFMKEKFEYLIDKYNVKLVFNKDYIEKDNLFSLDKVLNKINNTYILQSDVYSFKNPFSNCELNSWCSLSSERTRKSKLKINKQFSISYTNKNAPMNQLIGISYINKNDSIALKDNVKKYFSESEYDNSKWEEALFRFNNISVFPKLFKNNQMFEITSYEDLLFIDSNSEQLESEIINIIEETYGCDVNQINNIKTLKKGMTNRSFSFQIGNDKYIMRIPGEGTDLLINRKQEAEVYKTIKDLHICDDLFYMNPDNGYKITKFIENSRVCDPYNQDDLQKCMTRLREFHNLKLKVNHEFNIFQQIEFYESLWNGSASYFEDYKETKKKVLQLKEYIDSQKKDYCLTHIDAVPDNFLFSDINGKEEIRLIDWEYAGMQDPHVDIAMFCIYSLYDEKSQIDNLIDLYFQNKCPSETRIKIYCYVTACGLLWSNWCEYKRQLGIEFGEYSIKQYRYAKEYYKIATEEMKKLGAE